MSEHSDVSIRNYTPGHRFEAVLDGKTSVLTYELPDDKTMKLVHTVVPEALRGRGIATKLVEAVMTNAREHGIKLIPQCSMVSGYMSKHPETHDLLAPEGRMLVGL